MNVINCIVLTYFQKASLASHLRFNFSGYVGCLEVWECRVGRKLVDWRLKDRELKATHDTSCDNQKVG